MVDTDQLLALRPELYALAMKLTKDNTHDSDDLVQETIYKAIKNQASFTDNSGADNLIKWLSTILRNTFLNMVKAQKYHLEVEEYEKEQEKEHRPSTAHHTYDYLEGVELSDQVRAVFLQIPESFRAVVYLHYIQGYTCDEISKELNIKIGTVLSRLYRGREILKELWVA